MRTPRCEARPRPRGCRNPFPSTKITWPQQRQGRWRGKGRAADPVAGALVSNTDRFRNAVLAEASSQAASSLKTDPVAWSEKTGQLKERQRGQ